jgi:hypothetical protein
MPGMPELNSAIVAIPFGDVLRPENTEGPIDGVMRQRPASKRNNPVAADVQGMGHRWTNSCRDTPPPQRTAGRRAVFAA